MICVSEKPKYFSTGDWTGQISLIALMKLDFWRTGFARSARPGRANGERPVNHVADLRRRMAAIGWR
jgi:hypothetical protein